MMAENYSNMYGMMRGWEVFCDDMFNMLNNYQVECHSTILFLNMWNPRALWSELSEEQKLALLIEV
jgi:hypothetical protein